LQHLKFKNNCNSALAEDFESRKIKLQERLFYNSVQGTVYHKEEIFGAQLDSILETIFYDSSLYSHAYKVWKLLRLFKEGVGKDCKPDVIEFPIFQNFSSI
jgi:hypothetical protein